MSPLPFAAMRLMEIEMDELLSVLLFGDTTRSYRDLYAGYENVKLRRLSDPGSGYQGPSRPRPAKTAYFGYDWPDAHETYFRQDGKWLNCETMSVWEDK